MMNNIRLCVIIPTYNNEKTVLKVVEDVHQYVKDVIVVNDGSTDATAETLRQAGQFVSVISHERNKGKGHALLSGIYAAKSRGFTHIITIDADGQHFASDIPVLLSATKHNSEGIIVGHRNLTETNMPRGNTFANKFSNFWFRLQTTINLPDTQSGYRLYNLSSLKGLRWITARYESELELLVFAAWGGVKITSVPVKVYYPPVEDRVSHFHPVYDFARISILNTILCIGALFYGYPMLMARKLRKILK